MTTFYSCLRLTQFSLPLKWSDTDCQIQPRFTNVSTFCMMFVPSKNVPDEFDTYDINKMFEWNWILFSTHDCVGKSHRSKCDNLSNWRI